MSIDTHTVAIIGGAGYVGIRLARRLNELNIPVEILCRSHHALLCEHYGLTWKDVGLLSPARRYAVVVNLAYPKAGPAYWRIKQNRKIVDLIGNILVPGGKVIQASSLAVFGFGLERPIQVQPLRLANDYEYVMSKILMERMLIKQYAKQSLTIVRLGNIIGPEGAGWIMTLIERIRSAKPVAVRGAFGYSNATDIGNVVAYLVGVIQQAVNPHWTIQHLAEFSAVPWRAFAETIARQLRAPLPPEASLPTVSSVGRLPGLQWWVALRKWLREEARTRNRGGFIARGLSCLPEWSMPMAERMKGAAISRPTPHLAETESIYRSVFGATKRFENHGLLPLTLPISLAESQDRIIHWMNAAGY